MKKIFVVEDDENIRDLVLYALKSNGFACTGFENAQLFFKQLKCDKPDLLLLDIMLPDMDGIHVLKNIREMPQMKTLPVILLTAKSNEYDKVIGLDTGADDYITKPFSVLELISRIKALFRRTAQDNDTAIKGDNRLQFGSIVVDTEKHTVAVSDTNITLTYKEFELLVLFLKNVNRVLSREKIMELVWGFDFEGESRTVDMHIKTLRQKLGEQGASIKTIRGVGYKIGD